MVLRSLISPRYSPGFGQIGDWGRTAFDDGVLSFGGGALDRGFGSGTGSGYGSGTGAGTGTASGTAPTGAAPTGTAQGTAPTQSPADRDYQIKTSGDGQDGVLPGFGGLTGLSTRPDGWTNPDNTDHGERRVEYDTDRGEYVYVWDDGTWQAIPGGDPGAASSGGAASQGGGENPIPEFGFGGAIYGYPGVGPDTDDGFGDVQDAVRMIGNVGNVIGGVGNLIGGSGLVAGAPVTGALGGGALAGGTLGALAGGIGVAAPIVGAGLAGMNLIAKSGILPGIDGKADLIDPFFAPAEDTLSTYQHMNANKMRAGGGEAFESPALGTSAPIMSRQQKSDESAESLYRKMAIVQGLRQDIQANPGRYVPDALEKTDEHLAEIQQYLDFYHQHGQYSI